MIFKPATKVGTSGATNGGTNGPTPTPRNPPQNSAYCLPSFSSPCNLLQIRVRQDRGPEWNDHMYELAAIRHHLDGNAGGERHAIRLQRRSRICDQPALESLIRPALGDNLLRFIFPLCQFIARQGRGAEGNDQMQKLAAILKRLKCNAGWERQAFRLQRCSRIVFQLALESFVRPALADDLLHFDLSLSCLYLLVHGALYASI